MLMKDDKKDNTGLIYASCNIFYRPLLQQRGHLWVNSLLPAARTVLFTECYQHIQWKIPYLYKVGLSKK